MDITGDVSQTLDVSGRRTGRGGLRCHLTPNSIIPLLRADVALVQVVNLAHK
jgi:hypothetical protein